jgi:hypothetical protein
LKDILPVESPDLVVITKAQEIDAILLSLNGDFSHIVNYPPKNYKGIVALQIHNHAEILPKLIARLTAYLKVNTTMDHYRGKLLVVEVDRIPRAGKDAAGLRAAIRFCVASAISSTLKKALAMQDPVIVGVPVHYRDNHRLMENVRPEALK